MRSYQIKSAILTVSVIILIMSIIVTVDFKKNDRQSEGTTTAFSATVKNVVVTETETKLYPKIYVNESETCLLINSISKEINLDIVRNLQPGQKIYFRIEDYKAEQLDGAKIVDIVSLRTDTQVIYSLDDYNRHFNETVYPRNRKFTCIFIALNATVIVLTYLSMKKQRDNDPRF